MTFSPSWRLTEFDSYPWFDTTNSWPFPSCDFLLNLTWLIIGFNWIYATGVACRQGTLTPPDTWYRSFGTFICYTCWDQSFSELVVIFTDYALRFCFNFHITNSSFLCSNSPSLATCSVSILQIIRYDRARSSLDCLVLMATRLSNKIPAQGYAMEHLKPSVDKLIEEYSMR